MRTLPGRIVTGLSILLCAAASMAHAQTYRLRIDTPIVLSGTHFDLDAGASLVSSVDSTLMVDVLLHATPRTLILAITLDPEESSGTVAHLTLSGLQPGMVYYRYTDDFEHLDVVTADAEGNDAFDLDLSSPRLVFVQTNPSTIHLQADGTGCPLIGTFDAATLTCTLKRDVLQSIEIDDDGLTLDGHGFKIDGTSAFVGSSAVLVRGRTGVTVRNLVVDSAAAAVTVSASSDSTFENITVTNGNGGFLVLFEGPAAGTGRNTFRNNSVSVVCAPPESAPCGYGFSGVSNNADVIADSTFTNAKYGVSTAVSVLPVITGNTITACDTGVSLLSSLSGATIDGNTISGGAVGMVLNTAIGCEVRDNLVDGATDVAARIGSRECSLSDNTFSNSGLGLDLLGSANTIVHNRFISNAQQAQVDPATTDNLLSQPPRIGGNHWSDYDEAAEGCVDADADGYCDAPHPVPGGIDEEPWAADRAWLDVTPPATSVTLTGLPGNAGWFRSQVTATFTAADDAGGTGVLRSEYSLDGVDFTPADPDATISGEGTTDLFFRSVDRAGNAETPQSVPVGIDTVPPSVAATLDPTANANGWNRSAVTVHFACSDAVSGVATCPGPAGVSAEGAGQVVSGEATDVAGNTGSGSATVNLDLTPPAITFSGGCGGTFLLNGAASTSLDVSDVPSGIEAQSAPDGSLALATSAIGPQSLPVSARDLAGNVSNAACAYDVIYDFYGPGGFQPPLDPDPIVNTAKAGSAIPVKWQLPDGKGGFLSDLAVVRSIQAQQVSCNEFSSTLSDPVETSAAGASGLHFDFTSMQYIYNWKTERQMANKCYLLILTLNDGRSYMADFRFTR